LINNINKLIKETDRFDAGLIFSGGRASAATWP
jgi:hypothetical protein